MSKFVVHFASYSGRKVFPDTWKITEMVRETAARWYPAEDNTGIYSDLGYRTFLPKEDVCGVFDTLEDAQSFVSHAKAQLHDALHAWAIAQEAASKARQVEVIAHQDLCQAVDNFLKPFKS